MRYTNIKAISVITYILNGKSINLDDLYLILYLVDCKHLVEYGRTVTGDTYQVKDGNIYPTNIVKLINGKLPLHINIVDVVISSNNIDTILFDYMSVTDMNAITIVLNNIKLNGLVKNKSYNLLNKSNGKYLTDLDIAVASGGDDVIIDYINLYKGNDVFCK